jgi:RNA polymerase sigma factor (sigma-70 family)
MVIEADHRLESDSSLVAQAASGDESAYKALYERHHQHLLAVLRASVPAPLAEEAAQEAWARAYERIHSLDKPQAFFAWLSTIARNYARDHHRSTGSESLSLGEDHDWIPEPTPGPDTLVEHDEDRRFAARALQRLPDKQRAALVLRNLQGRSYVSIAGRLGLSVSATETLLHRARSNFQREYSSLQSGVDTPALACYKMRSSLRALASGGLSDLRRMRVIAHLESCEGCRSTHDEMRRTRRIAGFIPFFLPVAWLRDKVLHLGRSTAEGIGKLAPGGGAGAGAAPAAIVGTFTVATLTTAIIVSGIALDFGVPFTGSDSGHTRDTELVSDATTPFVSDFSFDLPSTPQASFEPPSSGTNGVPVPPFGPPAGGSQFGFFDDDLVPFIAPPPEDPPDQPAALSADCTTDASLCANECETAPLTCQPPQQPPCVDQDPSTEGCQEEPPCVDQDPNTEGCQPEHPCAVDPNLCTPDNFCDFYPILCFVCDVAPQVCDIVCEFAPLFCDIENGCEINPELCPANDPDTCEIDPTAAECETVDPCEIDPQAQDCRQQEGCDLNPTDPACQQDSTPPGDQCTADPNAEGCQPADPCLINPEAEGCQPPETDRGGEDDNEEEDDGCPGNSSNGHNCGDACDKPGQGGGNGYGHCKDNAGRGNANSEEDPNVEANSETASGKKDENDN